MKHILSLILWMTVATQPGTSIYATSDWLTDHSVEEYAVYAAVAVALDQMFNSDKAKLFVIRENTVKNDFPESESLGYLRKNFPSISRQTANDYKIKNKDSIKLKQFKIKIEHVLLANEDYESISKERGKWWKVFYKRYPGANGFIGFSRAGFNEKMDQALVYVERARCWRCATGHQILLQKRNGIWKVVKEHKVWVS